MAKVIDNILVSGISGTVGNLNFYNRKGTNVVRGAKTKRKGKGKSKFTDAQISLQDKFSSATDLAGKAIADADLKWYYMSLARGGQSAYNMALKDAMTVPQISEIDFESYNGQPGDAIIIRARNFFKIYKIHVVICNDAGILIEEGDAAESRTPMVWSYHATKGLGTRKAKVVISAESIPGNVTTLAKMIVVE